MKKRWARQSANTRFDDRQAGKLTENKLRCESCGGPCVGRSDHGGRIERQAWCPSCSVDKSSGVVALAPNGHRMIAVLPVVGQGRVELHPLSELPRLRAERRPQAKA